MATINGTSGKDKLKGTSLADTINGLAGVDKLWGGAGNDTINGGDGNDTIYGEAGNDTISGGNGTDVVKAGDGNDTVDGDAGNDRLYGDNGDDTVTGGVGADKLYGGAGTDTLTGGDGNDYAYGGTGNDTISGGNNNDYLYGDMGVDTITGGDGNDTLIGGHGADALDGGNGTDTVSYVLGNQKAGVVIDLVQQKGFEGDAEGDVYTSIENATGSVYNDEIYGDGNANVLNGYYGDDYIVDGLGNDTVYGGEGNDLIVATEGGSNTYDGDGGLSDTLDLSAWTSALTINMTTGKITGSGTQTVREIEVVIGTDQVDTYTGSALTDTFKAGADNDIIRSMAGFDKLWGEGGADTFVFFSVDVMDNTFGWLGYDKIYDFTVGSDVLDISGMLDGITFADIDDVVSLVDTGTDTIISARYTDQNTDEVRFAVLVGVTGETVASLDAAGAFVTA